MATLTQSPKQQVFHLEPFSGTNVNGSPTQIDNHQSPDMLNINIDMHGALSKRTGYNRVFSTSLGTGQINGLYEFKKSNGVSYLLIAHNTKLYTQSGNAQPIQIYNGLANQNVIFFTMNDKCYIMDGLNNYLIFDGTIVSQVTPYIPTMFISKPPAGGGTAYEDFNLLGSGFKESFSGDGTSTVYQLSLNGLDSTPVTATVNNINKVEGTDFTVDRVNGKITFVTAPATGVPNNVIITAYKTVSGFPEKIKNCRFSTSYGGSNDSRIFLSGNPNLPGYVYHLGLLDPTYAPENGYNKFNDVVKGFSKQYSYLVIHRENGLSQITYEINNGVASFPSKPINDKIGTLCTKSIQIIENNPVLLSKDGVYMLTATNVIDERNLLHTSLNIDKKLLLETNLENAISVDFDRKYWLAINGNVYILDYTQKTQYNQFGEWYTYNNIYPSCFIEKDGYLYFGSSKEGLVYKFNNDVNNANSYNDDGQPIEAYWKSKPLTFNADEMYKFIDSIYVGINPSSKTSIDITYESDKQQGDITGNQQIKFNLFDFSSLDFANFSFHYSQFPQVFKRRVKAKKVSYFQLKVENNNLNEGLTVLSLAIKYRYQSLIK